MKTLFFGLLLILGPTLFASEPSMESAIDASFKYSGLPVSKLDVRFESKHAESGVTCLERSYSFDGVPLVLNVTSEQDLVDQISWSGTLVRRTKVYSEIYRHIAQYAARNHYRVISSSVALDGVNVLGVDMTHPDTGVFFWTSLLDFKRRVRIDLSYVVSLDGMKYKFKMTAYTGATLPSGPQGNSEGVIY